MTDQQANSLGIEALHITQSEPYQLAMKAMREAIVQKWKDCPIRDQEGQRLLLQTMRLADTFEEVLTGMVETGKFAHHRLQQAIDEARNESGARKLMRRVL